MIGGMRAGVNDLLDAGREYLRRGWCVIPIGENKKPTVAWARFQRQRPQARDLANMIGSNATGLAVIAGKVSGGLAIRDFDDEGAFFDWRDSHPGEAARLPIVETCRGFHVYGRLDDEQFHDFGNGELRGDSGHYTVLPPSLHPSGKVYKWLNPLPPLGMALEKLPLSLLSLDRLVDPSNDTLGSTARGSGKRDQNTFSVPGGAPKKTIFLTEAIARTLPTGPGNRHRCLFKFVRRLRFGPFALTLDERKRIVRDWLDGAIAAGTKDRDFSQTWREFEYGWDRAKHSIDGNLSAAKAIARQTAGSVREKLFVFCRELAADDGSFFMSYGDAADATGCTKQGAFNVMRGLVQDGVVALVKCGEPFRGGMASEWKLLE
jgi:Bifunctional DNA primase/polymerase, N-terminal